MRALEGRTRFAGSAICALALLGLPGSSRAQAPVESPPPRLLVVPFELADGEQASPWARALLPKVGPLLAGIRAELAKGEPLEWVALTDVDPTEVEIALGEGKSSAGVLQPGPSRTLAKAAEADWILMGELTRRAGQDAEGTIKARLELHLAVYDARLATLIHDADVSFEQTEAAAPVGEKPVIPPTLLRRLWREAREDIAQRVLNAAFPPRITQLRPDGAIEIDAGDEAGLHPRLVLEFFESRRSQTPLGKLKVEYVGNGSALARPLSGEPRAGLYVRPLDAGRREKVVAEPSPPPPPRSNGFLLKALAVSLVVISIPLVITVIIERRKPQRTAAERIRVTQTVGRKRKRAGAAAWEAGLEARLRRTEERRKASGRPPRPKFRSAWDMRKGKQLQIHAVGDSSDSHDALPASSDEADAGIDMNAMAAEGPAGSFAYASAASQLRDLVEDAWATSSAEDLIPAAVELEAAPESDAPSAGGDTRDVQARPVARPRARDAASDMGPSTAQRRLDELLGD